MRPAVKRVLAHMGRLMGPHIFFEQNSHTTDHAPNHIKNVSSLPKSGSQNPAPDLYHAGKLSSGYRSHGFKWFMPSDLQYSTISKISIHIHICNSLAIVVSQIFSRYPILLVYLVIDIVVKCY